MLNDNNSNIPVLLMTTNLKLFIYSTASLLFNKNFREVYTSFWDTVINKSLFITTFYVRSENMWQDGFLFDFLQKKTADAWVRRFVIYTGFLFSERLVFDSVVRVYLDNLIWPGHNKSIFETSNVSEMLTSVIFLLITLWFLLFTSYTFLVL